MKTMLSNLAAIAQNTQSDNIRMIEIDELHESEDNFFEVNRVEEFADTILGQGGVKDNLIVRPLETGGYEIISGHRRRAAVQHLLDRGENISRYLPCLVQNYSDEETKMLDIVLMNISARQISDAEIWRSYEVIDRILKGKKTAGERFGRVRETLAELLGVSPAQVGKMQNVEKNAISAVIEAVESGEISISTANAIARMDAEAQEELVQQSDLSNISPKDLKKKKQDKKVDTNINFPKSGSDDDVDDDAVSDADDTKVDTSINFSETDSDDAEEVSEPDTDDSKVDINSNLAAFIHENYYDLEAIFEAYIGLTDDEDEAELLKDFLPLLHEVKENVRNQVRFGF